MSQGKRDNRSIGAIPRGRELFDRIIREWQKRPNPNEAFAFNQIASLVLGLGNSENARIIGQVVNQYQAYFVNVQRYIWRVNWEAVRQDHSHFFTAGATKPVVEPCDPIQGMVQALNDEIREAKRKAEEKPIIAFDLKSLNVVGQGGSFLYHATLDLERDDELPIPEGVGILLRWEWGANKVIDEAKLLHYDAVESKIIIETEKPLNDGLGQNWFKVFPRTDDLLRKVKGRVEVLKACPDSLAQRLLD